MRICLLFSFDAVKITSVLASQRHSAIVDLVTRQGSVRVRELSTFLGVSEMTVRRDLDTLEKRQLLDKVHGGAVRTGDRTTNEPGFEVKQWRQLDNKDAIARAGTARVKAGSAIGLTAGTTTWTLAKRLTEIPDLTVVTNSPSVAQVLYSSPRPDLTVVLTGGTRTPSDALVGPLATAALATLQLDQLFLGIHGMDEEHGFSTPNMAEAELNRAFLASSREVIVLADHSKWNIPGMAQIAPLDRADVVISDRDIPQEAIDAFEDIEVELQLTGPLPTDS